MSTRTLQRRLAAAGLSYQELLEETRREAAEWCITNSSLSIGEVAYGKDELVVQDAKAYQDLLDRVQTIEGKQRGRADVKAGRTPPARKVFDRLRRKHGIPH
jgi:hypothetical protein